MVSTTQGLRPHAIAALGLQLVLEERLFFGSLSVEENLVLAGLSAVSRWPLERVWEIFPRLRDRRQSRGTDLSGGEQQMLAIARALVREPRFCCWMSRSRAWRPSLYESCSPLAAPWPKPDRRYCSSSRTSGRPSASPIASMSSTTVTSSKRCRREPCRIGPKYCMRSWRRTGAGLSASLRETDGPGASGMRMRSVVGSDRAFRARRRRPEQRGDCSP